MKIVGLEPCSFIDYPGKLSAVVFTAGCNLNCFYCHNRPLIRGESLLTLISADYVTTWLARRQGLLDGVVITGGEPTLQPDLAEFVRMVRAKGYLVKVDTNGTRPGVLGALIEEGIVDYVAMDVKAPPSKYAGICDVPVDLEAIGASIGLLKRGNVDYEFRTTAIPQLTESDLLAIGQWVEGARKLVLQQYRRPEVDASAGPLATDPRLDVPPHEDTWPLGVIAQLETLVERCETRGFTQPQAAAEATAA